MIKQRRGDEALRVCDICGAEQWVSYWNVCKKSDHVCKKCSNKINGKKRRGNNEAWNKGKKSTRKVGSTYLDTYGYHQLYLGNHIPNQDSKYYREHRMMMEVKLGRELDPSEVVHHIDGDKTNNTFDNLFVCESQNHHRQVHNQLERLSYELIQAGLIKFNDSGKYFLDPFLREQVSKSGELLENPNCSAVGNQQRSFRNMTPEERSETIQKWSTLKRVEAPDALVANLATGDDIVPSPVKAGADNKSGKE